MVSDNLGLGWSSSLSKAEVSKLSTAKKKKIGKLVNKPVL
jgi:hypothetical protein